MVQWQSASCRCRLFPGQHFNFGSPASSRLENKNMLELLRSMLTGQNVLASGGLLLMIIGGMSVYLRAVPERLWHWIVGQTTMLITVKDDDAAFVWVKEWFLDQKFLA
jgi:hypothetical protein